MPSKGVSTIACSTPSFLATRSIMSTSKPTVLPESSLDWNGAYGRWVHTVSLPSAISCTLADPVPEAAGVVVAADGPLLQPASARALRPATATRDRIVGRDFTGRLLFRWPRGSCGRHRQILARCPTLWRPGTGCG